MRTRGFVGLGLCLVHIFGCSSGDADPEPEPRPEDKHVTVAAELGASWRGVLDESDQRPTFLVATAPPGPDVGALASVDAAARARAFLAAHPGLFGVAADGAVDVRSVAPDPRGGARVRLGVRVGGLPLEGGDVVVLLARDGTVRSVSGRFDAARTLAAAPTRDAASARSAAVRATTAETGAAVSIEGEPTLVAVSQPPLLRAAWKVVVTGDGVRREVFVDASTGAIFQVRDAIERIAGVGLDVHGDPRPIVVRRLGERRWDLVDEPHRLATFAGFAASAAGTPLASSALDHWDEGVFGAGAAVDAQANAWQVLDYLAVTFGRQGVDGHGGALSLVVHAGDRLSAAFWDGHRAVFGDGDGRKLLPLSGGLDVVAHELFHGVTQTESGLIEAAQSGALSESLSDVFGCLVELDRADGDWTIGDQIAAEPLRDLANPRRTHDPAHMSEYVELPVLPETDMGGVHTNSLIPSHAAYLVVMGGVGPLGDVTVSGVGDAVVRDVWWRASTMYIGPQARFADFAEATIAAAEDLYGVDSLEAGAVADAWRAVGVRPVTSPAMRSASLTQSFTETP